MHVVQLSRIARSGIDVLHGYLHVGLNLQGSRRGVVRHGERRRIGIDVDRSNRADFLHAAARGDDAAAGLADQRRKNLHAVRLPVEDRLRPKRCGKEAQRSVQDVLDLDRRRVQLDGLLVDQRVRRAYFQHDRRRAGIGAHVPSVFIECKAQSAQNPTHRNQKMIFVKHRRRVDGQTRAVEHKRNRQHLFSDAHFFGRRTLCRRSGPQHECAAKRRRKDPAHQRACSCSTAR